MSNPELSDEEAELGGFGSEAEEERPKDTEAIEDDEEKRRIDPSAESKKRVNRGPQPKLDAERLKGPKGVQTIEKYFQGFKFHGKGHEKQDLDRVMKRLEHWSYRLFPKLQFDDCLEKIERVGAKKELQVFLKKYRLGMLTEDDEVAPDAAEEERQDSEPIDEFDRLLGEEIEKRRSASAALPAPSLPAAVEERASSASSSLTDEIRERIERNRLEAIEKRRARWLKQQQEEEEERKRSEESGSTQVSESDELVPSWNADGSSREKENLTSQTDVLDIAERNRLAAIKRREERMREAEERRRNETEAPASISRNDNNCSANRPAAVSPARGESSRTETTVAENREMQNSREAEGSSNGEVGLVETENETDTAISAADRPPIRTVEETSTGATERAVESAEISETVKNWGEEFKGDLSPRKGENANGTSRENISPEASLATRITASPSNESWEFPEDAKRDSPQSGAKKRLLTREELRMEVEDALDRLIDPKYRRSK